MTARPLIALLAVAVVAALLIRVVGGGAARAPVPASGPTRVVARAARVPAPPRASRTPSRNLFEYIDARPAPVAPAAVSAPAYAAPEAPAPSPSPAVRVAGLVRRGSQLKAALVIEGEMTVAGKGERAGGYTVLDVDDEAGVRLRGPAGEEMVLPPPPF